MNETSKNIRLIAIYARVSTSHQEDEGTIQNQIDSLNEHAKTNGYTIVKEYRDDGWSGDTLVRPALDELRNDAKGKLWEGVLIYDPDRLSRRYSYQELVMDELREAGVEVLFVTISAPKNSEDKILQGVRGLFAEYERTKISERFRLGKLRKVKEGHVLTTEAPYGYRYIPNKRTGTHDKIHGYYGIDENEARVVRMIFGWVADEKYTMRSVVRKLQELGIKPRKSKRGVWSTSTLSTMLKHKVYIGQSHWGSTYAVVPKNPTSTQKYRKQKKSSRKIRPEEEWYMIPVPAIIDEALFNRVRAQLETNFAMCERNKKNEYLLAGKIHCSCGRRRGGEGPQKGKHLYYRCNDRVCSFPLPPTCHEKGINARIADKLVWKKVAELMSSPELMRKQIERWVNSRKMATHSSADNLAVLEKEVAKLKAQEDRYSKAYGAGVFNVEQLKEYVTPLREQLAELEVRMVKSREESREQVADFLPESASIERFAQVARDKLQNLSFAIRRAIITNVVEKIVATPQLLTVHGYIPIKSHVEFFTNDRNRRVAKCGEVHAFQRADKKVGAGGKLSFLYDRSVGGDCPCAG